MRLCRVSLYLLMLCFGSKETIQEDVDHRLTLREHKSRDIMVCCGKRRAQYADDVRLDEAN